MDAARTAIIAGALLLASGAGAQTLQPDPPAPLDPVAHTAPVPRAALLREGSQIVRVGGRLRRDAPGTPLVFTIDSDDPLLPRHALTMMPGTLLSEMERVVEESSDQKLVFEVTGRVFVYMRRNYLMLTHPPLLIAHEPIAEEAPVEDGDAEADADADATEDIIRGLEQSVGPVARRREADRRSGLGEADRYGASMLEGTMLLSRRGVVRRTGSGSFLFVFDADAEGLSDPPMILLPCLLLERLSRATLKARQPAAVLLSGDVFTYDRQNYLLPTVYRVPRDRTALTP